jgi:hypothetical protein
VAVVLAAAVLALSVIVLARNVTPDDELLATATTLAGLAILASALPDAR